MELVRIFFLTIIDPKAAEKLSRSRPSTSSFGRSTGGGGGGGGDGGGGGGGYGRSTGKPPSMTTNRPRFATLSQLRDASGNCAAGEWNE